MKEWFAGLDDREQKFVMSAAVVIVLAVLYLGIWLPLDKGQKQMQANVDRWRDAVEQLKPLKGRMGARNTPRISQRNLNQPLVVVIDSTLRARDLNSALKRSQPTGNNIRVEFESVSFDDMIMWLGDLGGQYALQVQAGSFSTTSNDSPGRVNAQLTLGR